MTKWRVFAERTKALLEEHGMTQRELAEQVGITEVSISRYMSGQRIPKATVIVKCAKALGVSADYLVGTEGKNVQPILRPCPFCGAPANIWSWNGGTRVDCSRWYSDPTATRVHFIGIGAKTPEEAIKIWNERWEDGEEG